MLLPLAISLCAKLRPKAFQVGRHVSLSAFNSLACSLNAFRNSSFGFSAPLGFWTLSLRTFCWCFSVASQESFSQL